MPPIRRHSRSQRRRRCVMRVRALIGRSSTGRSSCCGRLKRTSLASRGVWSGRLTRKAWSSLRLSMAASIRRSAVQASLEARYMSHPALVDTINATAAAVAETIYGGVHQTVQIAAARPVQDFILDFDLDTSYEFVGRSAIFEALDEFAARNPAGYFEIVADAGLGKTALAIEIGRASCRE